MIRTIAFWSSNLSVFLPILRFFTTMASGTPGKLKTSWGYGIVNHSWRRLKDNALSFLWTIFIGYTDVHLLQSGLQNRKFCVIMGMEFLLTVIFIGSDSDQVRRHVRFAWIADWSVSANRGRLLATIISSDLVTWAWLNHKSVNIF